MNERRVDDRTANARTRASEAMFAAILEIAADAIITIDDEQRILHFNHGAEEIFRWSADDVLGRPLDVLLPHRFRATHAQHIRAFGAGHETSRRMGHRREVSGLRADGTEFPAEASISKLDLAGGKRVYTVMLRDITERKRAEQAEHFLAEVGASFSRSLDWSDVQRAIIEMAVPRLADACLLDLVEGQAPIMRRGGAQAHDAQQTLRALTERFAPSWDSPSPVIDVLRRGKTELVEQVDDEWLEGTRGRSGCHQALARAPTPLDAHRAPRGRRADTWRAVAALARPRSRAAARRNSSARRAVRAPGGTRPGERATVQRGSACHQGPRRRAGGGVARSA
jgi:PAS domain S-box-containing protein